VPQKGKVDWNDCHQLNKLNEREIEAYLYQGALLLARSELEKAALLFNRKCQLIPYKLLYLLTFIFK